MPHRHSNVQGYRTGQALYEWYSSTIKKEYFNYTLPVYVRWLSQQPGGEFPSGTTREEVVELLRVLVAAAHGP